MNSLALRQRHQGVQRQPLKDKGFRDLLLGIPQHAPRRVWSSQTPQRTLVTYEEDLLYDALGKIIYPNKFAVRREALDIAERLDTVFQPTGYAFGERGSIYSEHVQYVSDMDVILIGELAQDQTLAGGAVSRDVAKLLQSAGRSLFEGGVPFWIQIGSQKEDRLTHNGHYKEVVEGRLEELIQSDTEALSLRGEYSMESAPGWRVPLDLRLSIVDKHGSKDIRRKEMLRNLELGDFAKVTQRVRNILPYRTKAKFAQAANSEVGRERFMVNQLKIAENMNCSASAMEYVRKRLHLPIEDERDIVGWRKLAETVMQEKAFVLLEDWQDVFLDVFLDEQQAAAGAYFNGDAAQDARMRVEQLKKMEQSNGNHDVTTSNANARNVSTNDANALKVASLEYPERSQEDLIPGVSPLVFFVLALSGLTFRRLGKSVRKLQGPLMHM